MFVFQSSKYQFLITCNLYDFVLLNCKTTEIFFAASYTCIIICFNKGVSRGEWGVFPPDSHERFLYKYLYHRFLPKMAFFLFVYFYQFCKLIPPNPKSNSRSPNAFK